MTKRELIELLEKTGHEDTASVEAAIAGRWYEIKVVEPWKEGDQVVTDAPILLYLGKVTMG